MSEAETNANNLEVDDDQLVAMPRRRLMALIRIQADDCGGIARTLVEMINWLEAQEGRAGGANKPLGNPTNADGDATRSFSIEVDDDPDITHDVYMERLQQWLADRAQV